MNLLYSYDYFPFTKIKPRSQTPSGLPYSFNVILIKRFISLKVMFIYPERLLSPPTPSFPSTFQSISGLLIRMANPGLLGLSPFQRLTSKIQKIASPHKLSVSLSSKLIQACGSRVWVSVPSKHQCQSRTPACLLQPAFLLTSSPFPVALQREYVTIRTRLEQDSYLLEKGYEIENTYRH